MKQPAKPKDGIDMVALDYAATLGVYQLSPIVSQPPNYVFNAGNAYVIRAIIAENAEAERERVAGRIKVLRELRQRGAQIMEFINEPIVDRGVVIVASPFYPHELPASEGGYDSFGQALATLHNAGWQMQAGLSQALLINPLKSIWDLLRYLQKNESMGRPFKIGKVRFPSASLPLFEEYLIEGQAAYDEMMKIATREQRLTALLLDVYPDNIRLDAAREPHLIDLLDEIVIGPPEYDLARPSAHWVQRIGRDPRFVDAFMEGYQQRFNQSHSIDNHTLQLAITVANIYYATSMLKNAVKAHRLGHPSVNEWQITEVVSRLSHLKDPTYRWKAARDYR